jgi:hypothetical protein
MIDPPQPLNRLAIDEHVRRVLHNGAASQPAVSPAWAAALRSATTLSLPEVTVPESQG